MSKVIFFGTSKFALPALELLQSSEEHNIVAVVTQPDKPVGRKKEFIHSPVKEFALKNNIQIFQPEHLKIENFELEIPQAELYIVASYGKIIPEEILEIPKYGTLNIHPSLLPKHRGPSPIQTAILNGDKETGVTIMKMDEKMDHGPIMSNVKCKISNVKYSELHDKLADLGAELLLETLPKYISGEIELQEQDHDKATYTKIIKKDDARINWTRPAEEIDRTVRAFEEWPVAWTMIDGKRLKIYESELQKKNELKPGQINFENTKFLIGCRNGDALLIKKCQMEGGKKLSAENFINGYKKLANHFLS